MFRIVQISDTHLAADQGETAGWRQTARWIARLAPDLVVHTGDIIWGEPDNVADHRFARRALDGLGVPWLAIPGNHDVGDGPPRPQTITGTLLTAFAAHYGAPHWIRDVEGWRLIGVNAMLFGSGLDEEAEEWRFLEQALAAAAGRQVLLFVHKPPFLRDPAESQALSASFPASARPLFWSALVGRNVRLIACGHRHEYRVLQRDGITIVWAPTTSALLDEVTPPVDPLGVMPGLIEYGLDGDTLFHRLLSFDHD